MIKLTLRQLEIFRAIAQNANVSKAANVIGLTQSAASMALKELENTLTEPVFYRQGKRLLLNNLGETLLKEADHLLEQAKAIEVLSQKKSTLSGTLKIGASSTIGNYTLPTQLVTFKNQHPQINIELTIANTEKIIEDLCAWRLDLGFIEGECQNPKVQKEFWHEDELIIIANHQHPLTQQTKVTLAELSTYPWIMRELGSGTLTVAENQLVNKLNIKEPWLRLGSNQAIQIAVKNSNALSLLSKASAADAIKHQQLAAIHLQETKFIRPFYMISLKQRFKNQQTQAFISFIKT